MIVGISCIVISIYITVHLAPIVSRSGIQNVMTMAASRVGISHGRVCDGFDVDVAVSNNQARTMSDLGVG